MPMPGTELLERIANSGLPSLEAARGVWSRMEQSQADGAALAKELVRQGILTKFQAQSLYAGRYELLVLEKYVLQEEIGRGGMGVVYRALDIHANATVAIKVLSPQVVGHGDAVARFEREANALAAVQHPHVVVAMAARKHREHHFLVMEYLDGSDLETWVHQHGPATLQNGLDWTLQAARGIECAHRQGIVHRDVKPRNLFLTKTGVVKVLDLGLARIVAGESGNMAELTDSGLILGSAAYMAPEQADDSRKVDKRADIYSLGCTMYYLLRGQPPYHAKSSLEWIEQHRHAPIPTLTRDPILERLQTLMARMLGKRPDERPFRLGEVISTLEIIMENTPTSRLATRLPLDTAGVSDSPPLPSPGSTTLTPMVACKPPDTAPIPGQSLAVAPPTSAIVKANPPPPSEPEEGSVWVSARDRQVGDEVARSAIVIDDDEGEIVDAEIIDVDANPPLRLQVDTNGRGATPTVDEDEIIPEGKQDQREVVCPSCDNVLPPKSKLCTNCGYDLKRKTKIEGAFVGEKKKKKKRKAPQKTSDGSAELTPTTWKEILQTPFDVEFVLAETFILAMWMLVWLGIFGGIFASLVFMNFASILAASAIIAAMLRMWMAATDISLEWIFGGLGIMALVSYVGAVGFDILFPIDEGAAHFRRFALFFIFLLSLILLLTFARMVSFFFGRYFAICRRAAMQKYFVSEDNMGLFDLAYALGILGIAGAPLLVVGIASLFQAIHAESFWLVPMPLSFLTGSAAIWCYFYLPMGVAVVALRRSIHPRITFRWISGCGTDYLALLGLLLPFHLVIWLSSALIASLLIRGGIYFAGISPILSGFLYFAFTAFFLSQYTVVVTMVALGRLMRRHESTLRWYKHATEIY